MNMKELIEAKINNYQKIRQNTINLTARIPKECFDMQVCPEASPVKWHLGHTTWFYEYFLLLPQKNYKPFNEKFFKFFNSYYKGAGEHIVQEKRGEQTQASLLEVLAYRKEIDEIISQAAKDFDQKEMKLLTIGIEHEKQHQELILMDVLRLNFEKKISYLEKDKNLYSETKPIELTMHDFSGGLSSFGQDFYENKFCYDNETPAHHYFLRPFKLANRLVTNGEYQEFIDDSGYETPSYWLSDGWKWVQENKIKSPLYWKEDQEFSLSGYKSRDKDLPVRHISFYEAQAYARFRNKRLPTEHEWEYVAQKLQSRLKPVERSFNLDLEIKPQKDFEDLFSTLWQWTQSSYSSYPGYKWERDILGEYNGKFMINQMILRGGASVTPDDHLRITYRNFFYPHQRWAFTGIRLAEDV